MAPGFDELMASLLDHVALSGSKGLGYDEVTNLVKIFYDQGNGQEQQHDFPDHPNLLFSSAPPTSTATVVDGPLVDSFWDRLSHRPDIQDIDASEDFTSEQPIVVVSESIAFGDSLDPLTAGAHHSAGNHVGKRLVATEERIWSAICGHGVDFHRIPPLEFECLQVIAAHGAEGIIQPRVTNITGQDKRSVPKRTDALAAKGYITKTRVCASKLQTTLMRLMRYGQPTPVNVPTVKSKTKDNREASESVLYYEKWWDTLIELLKSQNNGVVALDDLRIELGVKGKNETRALRRCIRRLIKAQFLTRLSAPVSDANGNATKKIMRCVRMLREPVVADNMAFRAICNKGSETKTKSTQGVQAVNGDDSSDDDDQDDSGSLTARQQLNSDVFKTRVVPRWTPDKPYPNLLFDIIDSAGPQGISSMDLCAQSMGPLWRRPLDELMIKLTDVWQKSQPPHLRQLTLVRNASVQNKFAHYIYWSYDKFQEAVQQGSASWETALDGVSFGSKGKQNSTNIWPEAVLDDWGFPPLQAHLFEANGRATLAECRSMIVVADLSKRPKFAASSKPAVIVEIQSVNPATSVIKVPSMRENRSTAVKGGMVSKKKLKKGRATSRTEHALFETWSKNTARRLVNMERASNSIDGQPPAEYRRNGPSTTEEDVQNQAQSSRSFADRFAQVERDLLAQTRPGIYINPPGSLDLKLNTLKQPGRPRKVCIAVVKTDSLHDLPFFTSERADAQSLGVDKSPTRNKRKRGAASSDGGEVTNAGPGASGDVNEQPPGSVLDVPDGPLSPKRSKQTPNPAAMVESVQTSKETGRGRNTPPTSRRETNGRVNSTLSTSRSPTVTESATQIAGTASLSVLKPFPVVPGIPDATTRDIIETSRSYPKQAAPFIATTKKRGRPTNAMLAERERLRQEAAAASGVADDAPFLQGASILPLAGHIVDMELPQSPTTDRIVANDVPQIDASAHGARVYQHHDLPNAQSKPYLRSNTQPTLSSGREAPWSNGKDTGVLLTSQSQHRQQDPPGTASAAFPVEKSPTPLQHTIEDRNKNAGASKPSMQKPAMSTIAKTAKTANANRVRGVMFHQRTKIAMDIVRRCEGVYPGNREIFYPFATAWQRLHGLHPDRHTVDRVVKGLVDNHKLKKVVFSFKTKKGLDKTAPVLMLPEIDHLSEKVMACKQQMIDTYPASYIPPDADVSPELRSKPANYPVPSGRKVSESVWRTDDGGITRVPPPHYSRDNFPVVKGLVVKRTDAGVQASDLLVAKASRKRWLYQSTYDSVSLYDPDPNGTDDDEVTDEQLAMQGEIQMASYTHTPEDSAVERRNGKGKLSRLLMMDPALYKPRLPTMLHYVPTTEQAGHNYLPSVAAHTTFHPRSLLALASSRGGALEQLMPAELRALLMRPGTQVHPASCTIGTNSTMETVTDQGMAETALPGRQQAGQRRLQSLQSLLQPSKQQLAPSRMGGKVSGISRRARFHDPSWSPFGNEHDATAHSGSANAAQVLEGPAYRFFREVEQVEAWEIGRLDSGSQKSKDDDLAGTFINHHLNQDLVEPDFDENFLVRERRKLGFAAETNSPEHGLPNVLALNNNLSTLLARIDSTAPCKNSQESNNSRAFWSPAEEAALCSVMGDPLSKRMTYTQLAEEFQSQAGTQRTWAAMSQHYRKMIVLDMVESRDRGPVDESSTAIATGQLREDSSYPAGPSQVIYDVPAFAQEVPDKPTPPDGQRGFTSLSFDFSRQEKPADVVPAAARTAPSASTIAGRKHRFKSRKRKAALEDEDYEFNADEGQMPTPRKKRMNWKSTKHPGFREPDRLLHALVAVSTLTGGTDVSINWSLVAHAMGFRYEGPYLKERWLYLKLARLPRLHELQDLFRAEFLSAYEAGALASIDFQNLQKTDWPALVDWVEREVVPKPEFVELKVAELGTSRADLEADFQIINSTQPCAPDRENWFTGLTENLRGNTALKLTHGDTLTTSGTQLDDQSDGIILAKSWFRAVVATKEAQYDASAAAQKMRTLSGAAFSQAQRELLADQVIMQVKSGRQLPGRNFNLSKRMWKELSRWPKGDVTYLRDVAAAREAVLAHFRTHDRYEQSLRSNDAEMLVLTNMVAQGQVKVTTELPERDDDTDAPWPKLSIWGYTDFEYETKRVDKSRLRFPVAYQKTPSLTEQHGLKSGVPIPTQVPQINGEMQRRIPLWIDIHDNLIDDMWDTVVRSVLHVLVFRPGSTLQGMEDAHHGRLWAWEIELVVLWMQQIGLAIRSAKGSGWRSSKWWYCAFVPEIATWEAPSEADAAMANWVSM